MKNHSSFLKIPNHMQNYIIKIGLFLCFAIIIIIIIETGKDFIQNSYKFKQTHIQEKRRDDQNRLNIISKDNIRTTIKSSIFNKVPGLNAGITLYKNIESPQKIIINKNSISIPIKHTQCADIQSFIEYTSNLTKVVLVTEALNRDLEIPEMKSNSTETRMQGMTISQQGNFNVAIQVNVKNAGQIQYIQQIGSNNNNPYQNNNDIRNSYIDNSLSIITKPIMLINVLKNSIDESLSFPVSQYSNQKWGIAVEKVFGNDNNTYQFQESTDQQSVGRNEAYLSLKGNENDVVQGQSGFHNSSKIDITGNRNLVTNSQYGELNYAGITISSGIKNVVNVEQVGFNNFALIFQNGVNNIINVVQHQ